MEEDHQPPTRTTPLLHFLSTTLRLKTTLWSELAGSVGDLGTYIPILLSLTLTSHLDLSTTLIFTSLYNISTGFLFNIPMPVQPMKSIAAVAVSELPHLTVPQISAAGISTAVVLLFLGATGLMSFLYKFIPLPVVRGVQLSQGLSFAFTAVKYVQFNQDFAKGKSGSTRSWVGLDGLIIALFSFLFLIICTGSGDSGVQDSLGTPRDSEDIEQQRNNLLNQSQSQSQCQRRVRNRLRVLSSIPAALIVFLVGIVLCFIRDPSIFKDLQLGPSKIQLVKFTWEDWKVGFLRAAIPQIPLSILNSVIAVCKLSGDLFPEKEVSATAVSISVGVMNLVGCWFGAMPVCHGAGGLAGQYRFGGRSGLSVVFLGVGKLVLGLVFGNSFGRILGQFPIGILGVLLLFAGIELAMASRDMNSKEESFVMLVCAAVSLTGSSAALGFGCGIVLFLLLKMRQMEWTSCVGFLKFNSKSSLHDEAGQFQPLEA